MHDSAQALRGKKLLLVGFTLFSMFFGAGNLIFPPFLGGPFRYMDSLGIDHLVGRLEHYQKRHGDRFAPCARLKAMAAEQQRFY